MQKRPQVAVEKRTIFGKHLKKLRREGILPANVYGKDLASVAVQLPLKEFNALFKEVGETGLIDLKVDSTVRPVLIKNIQVDHVADTPVHADFYQVNLKEKIKSMIPVITVGEPAAVTEKVGLLLQTLSEIEVEALPEALPENFEVNVEKLAAVDDQITVADLKAPVGVEILTDPEQVIVKISELVSKEAEELTAEVAAEAEAASAETAEGETPTADGEKPTEEKTEEKSDKPKEEKS